MPCLDLLQHAARCSNDQVHPKPVPEASTLSSACDTSDDRDAAKAGSVPDGLGHCKCLKRKLACWSQNHCARPAGTRGDVPQLLVALQAFNQRQKHCQCFASPRCRAQQNILASEECRYRELLNGCRLEVALCLQPTALGESLIAIDAETGEDVPP